MDLSATISEKIKICFDLNFDLKGHPRSKVMVTNESLIRIFYLTSIVTYSNPYVQIYI